METRTPEDHRTKSELRHLIFSHLSQRTGDDELLLAQVKPRLWQTDITIAQYEAVLTILEARGTLHQVSLALDPQDICASTPFPKCNNAQGCATCEYQKDDEGNLVR